MFSYFYIAPPLLIEGTRNRTAIEGENVEFNCIPSPLSSNGTVMWLHEGEIVQDNNMTNITTYNLTSTLSIKNLDSADAGDYICVFIDGTFQTVSNATVTLKIQGKSQHLIL